MSERDHAVVLGAGMAGMSVAKVLADRFDRVTVVERDELPESAGHRPGVPQGRQLHVLMPGGRAQLEALFPGLTAELGDAGAPIGDLGGDGVLQFEGGRLATRPAALLAVGVSRPRLEAAVRARVRALPNVMVADGHRALDLLSSDDRRRVVGVRAEDASGTPRTLVADLVVDAAGRTSRATAWLGDLGYHLPVEESVHVGIGYATRTYRRRAGDVDGHQFVVVLPTPDRPRGGILYALENDRWMLTLAGAFDDRPPTEPEAFDAFAASLGQPEISEFVEAAEPLDEPVAYRFPASVRRRFERLRRFPEGYLVVGDAICSFNPIYGQGMTVAAREAAALGALLDRKTRELARRFYERAATIIDGPWDIAVGSDLRYPAVHGNRTTRIRFLNAYVARLLRVAHRDPAVGEAFLRVMALVDEPPRLLRPSIAVRVLAPRRQHTPTSVQSRRRDLDRDDLTASAEATR